MNVQELIDKYKEYKNALFDIGAKVACQKFLQKVLISQKNATNLQKRM